MTHPTFARSQSLAHARLAAHYAAQIPASFAYTWLEHDASFTFASLGWSDGALVSREAYGLRVALHVADFAWTLSRGDSVLSRMDVRGCTLEQAHAWLRAAAVAAGAPDRELVHPEWDLPESPISSGAAWDAEPGDLAQVAAWFALASGSVAPYAARPDASELRVWPHHFDIATLLTLDAVGDSEAARSVGIGMTPGDGGIPEPYFYVTPWPYPTDRTGPSLPGGGTWNTEGWFGAVLTGTALAGQPAATQTLVAFLHQAVQASLRSLTPTDRSES